MRDVDDSSITDRQGSATALWLAAAFCLAGLVIASLRPIATARHPAPVETELDIPAFPSEVTGPLSFGFRSLIADAMFLEAIQVLGARRVPQTLADGAPADRQLARLLEYATDLDPRFAGAYWFAGYAMPRSTLDGQVANVIPAEAILKRGVRERPDDWRIAFVLGVLQAFYLGEPQEAAVNLAHAARIRGSPAYLGLLANRLAVEGGDLDSAEQMARTMVEEASEQKTREEWQARLVDLRMERDMRRIEAAVKAFRARTGRNPDAVRDLVRAGDLAGEPVEPHGKQYLIEQGVVRSTAGRRPRLHRGHERP
jgi:hypothetical protein